MQRVAFDVALIERDMVAKGFNAADVANLCDPPVAKSSVTRFLNGTHQTAKMAKRIARVLGYASSRRYLVAHSEVG